MELYGHKTPLSFSHTAPQPHCALHWFNASPGITYTPRTFMDIQLYELLRLNVWVRVCVYLYSLFIAALYLCLTFLRYFQIEVMAGASGASGASGSSDCERAPCYFMCIEMKH